MSRHLPGWFTNLQGNFCCYMFSLLIIFYVSSADFQSDSHGQVPIGDSEKACGEKPQSSASPALASVACSQTTSCESSGYSTPSESLLSAEVVLPANKDNIPLDIKTNKIPNMEECVIKGVSANNQTEGSVIAPQDSINTSVSNNAVIATEATNNCEVTEKSLTCNL